MFPLEFPLGILRRRAKMHQSVLDPFCGRGTTNFAARLVGLRSLGVDSSPVATAITSAKLVKVSTADVLAEAREILTGIEPGNIPSGSFWGWAYHADALVDLCRFRTAFLEDCSSPARIALRGIILGALHGPRQKTFQSYFSNQSPRTYAPKPTYATKYWQIRGMRPLQVNALEIIERRAKRYYGSLPDGDGEVRLRDSREVDSLSPESGEARFSWVITSPPYYGMRTYIPDQWLRYWFIGGPDRVDYTNERQVLHSSPESFTADLRKVWMNAAESCSTDATMVVRFGGISDRRADPLELAKASFRDSPWRLSTIRSAGSALEGKRQADAFLRSRSKPVVEYDLWARLS
ncbi:MAG: DNA modification methylase [Gammaproteobacteria bacterium]|nr:DNA modification methylase [Gammaproteobacteria bacterium]